MRQWFAVHSQANAEQKALLNLRTQGFEAYLPHYMKTRRHARRVNHVKAPLFPRYLFVRLDPERHRWRAVNSTYGVSHLICQGELPAPVSDRLIDEIRGREDASGAIRLNRIIPPKPGECVRIVSGPMMDMTGIFECELDEDRVVILLDIIGRSTRVTAPSDAIIGCA
jgi:transcriptional antiterminator RfaH